MIFGLHCFADKSNKVDSFFYSMRFGFFEITDIIRQYFKNISHNFSQDIGDKLFELQTENLNLRLKANRVDALVEDNNRLKTMLGMRESSENNIIFAKVISVFNNDFVRAALVNVGKNQEIKPDDFVYNENGLIGRVIEVSGNYSKVLLITDANSNIPSKIAGVDAMLCGDNSDLLKIKFLNENIKEGDIAETSSYGGVFQEKIIVGKIVKKKDEFFVKTAVNFNDLKYVCISRCESQ